MKLTFKYKSIIGELEVSDDLVDFFVWITQHREDKRMESLLTLIAEHENETDSEEKKNIRRTLDEILENSHILT